jgi:hypothetical protein
MAHIRLGILIGIRLRNEVSVSDLEELTYGLVGWPVRVSLYTDSHSYRQVCAPVPRTRKEGAVE